MKKEKKEKTTKEAKPKRKRIVETDGRNMYIYLLAMTLVLIVSNILSEYEISFVGYSILLSTFVYPLVYLFSYLITKEYGKERALLAILTAAMFQAGLYLSTYMLGSTTMDSLVITGSIISFITSQIVMIFLSDSLTKGNKVPDKAALFVVYVFAILIDTLIYLVIFRSGTMFEYEMPFILTSAMKSLVALAIAYSQYKIEGSRKTRKSA